MTLAKNNGLRSAFTVVLAMFISIVAIGTSGCKGYLERRAKAKQEALEMAANRQQASNLVGQAEGMLKDTKVADAEATLRQALAKDSGNTRAQELIAQISRDKAAAALETIKKLDPGQGFDLLLAAVNDKFAGTAAMIAAKEFNRATATFEEVCKDVVALDELEKARQAAIAVRKDADQEKALCVAINTAVDAPEQWGDGEQEMEKATQLFEKGDFPGASSNWIECATAFSEAKEWAKGVQSVRGAKAMYDRDLIAASDGPLEQFGGQPWIDTKQTAAEAEALGKDAKWEASVAKWGEARGQLVKAVKFAVDAAEAERLRKLLEEALAKHGSLMRLAKEQIKMSQTAPDMAAALKAVSKGVEEIVKASKESWYSMLPAANLDETRNMLTTLAARRLDILFPDMEPVQSAEFAPVESLAEGSAAAVSAQKTAMATHRLPLEMKSKKTGLLFRLIPAGSFSMGKIEKEPGDNDETKHTVTISRPFYVSRHEITQDQWQAAGASNKSHFRDNGNNPVECVTWDNATAWCDQLSRTEAVQPGCYRLLTEAEWEYTCRAGTKGRFCSGLKEGDMMRAGWSFSDSGRTTHPVGQKLANAWGIYDMHGNVWEWCSDSPRNYKTEAVADPAGDQKDILRVIRGGGWYDDFNECRSANRGSVKRSSAGAYDVGFRVVREIPTVID